jgi:predicted transcriptional regulator
MSNLKAKSFQSQVSNLINLKLPIKRRENTVLFKLLGFLLRNDSPFPYSIESLSKNTFYSRSSIFEALNLLEKYRLIERVGFTNRTKFQKGTLLKRMCRLIQQRIDKEESKNNTLVQKPDKINRTSPETGYQRPSSFIKHTNKGYRPKNYGHCPKYQEYVTQKRAASLLKVENVDLSIMTFNEFKASPLYNNK